MTHGAGGFSSGGGGGGGGFSGGGFSGGGAFANTSLYHSSKSSGGSNDDNDCCCFFCMCGINLISFLLCIRKMSRLVRVVLLWVYVLTLVLTVSLILRFNMLSINKFQAAPTDMAPVRSHLNNAFCQSMKLNSTNSFTAYSFDELPRVDPNDVEEFNTSYWTYLTSNNYEYWGFYLLEGSVITVSASGGSTMYVIKGSDNLQNWIDTEGSCSDCYVEKAVTSRTVMYKLNVSERDTYYLMFFSPTFTVSAQADVYIKRTLFDVSSSTRNCSYRTGSAPCSFEISLNPEQVIVYHNGRSSSVDQNIDMWSTCEPRVWMYVIVFGILPLSVGVALSFLILKFCKDSRSQERTALLEDSEFLDGKK